MKRILVQIIVAGTVFVVGYIAGWSKGRTGGGSNIGRGDTAVALVQVDQRSGVA